VSPVKGGAEKAARILAAEEQLHRIEQWRMADLERRLAELESMQIELIGALNDTNALHGLFIDTTARRLSSIAEEAELVGREKAAQALRLKEHAARVKLCQRLLRERERDELRDMEGKELMELVEQFVSRRRTSLP
jgi:hypothetical protein